MFEYFSELFYLCSNNLQMAIGAAVASSEHSYPDVFDSLIQLDSIQSCIVLSNAVFAVLDKTRELILITDHNHVVQVSLLLSN